MTRTLAFVPALLLAPSLAFAQAPPAAGPPPGPPPPPSQEIKDLAKWLAGPWSCEASWNASPFGPAHKAKATVSFKSELGGYLLTNHYKETKDKENPHPFDVLEWYGYVPALKKFWRSGTDNIGATQTGWGAWEGDTLRFDSESAGPMGKAQMKFTLSKRGPKEVGYDLQVQTPDGTWLDLGGGICKK